MSDWAEILSSSIPESCTNDIQSIFENIEFLQGYDVPKVWIFGQTLTPI